VLLALLAVLVWQSPAQAATHTVTLATSGPSPSAVTIKAGDTVTFRAGDGNTYHVRRTAGSWTFSATVTQAKPATTPAFTKPGTYSYEMTFDTLIGPSPPQSGSVVVPSSTPSPTASPTRSAAPRPSATASVRPVASPSTTAVPTQTGVAVPPPIQGAVIPTPSVTPSTGPVPQVAPPVLPGAPTPDPTPSASVTYSDKKLTQGSAHGIGLPAALAVVGVVGVVSLLVRLLLAAPEARPRVG
jgi:plastocyanin